MNPWKEERGAVWFVGLAPVICGLMLAFGENGALWALPPMTAVGMVVAAIMGHGYPWLKWTETGIHYRFFLKTHYLPWSEVVQAGKLASYPAPAQSTGIPRDGSSLLRSPVF